MTEVLNPVDIEQDIRQCSDRIHDGVKIVTARLREWKKATRVFDRAYAKAYLESQGPAHEKKYRATLATEAEADALDAAEVVYRHAERTAYALVDELRALQSVGASVRAMYGAQS